MTELEQASEALGAWRRYGMKELIFEILGEPRPCHRARSDGPGRPHDTPENRQRKQDIGIIARDAMSRQSVSMWEQGVPLGMDFVFMFKRPQRLRAFPNEAMWCVKVPDWDNAAKLVMDGIKGVAYHDDAQVSNSGGIWKVYAPDGFEPRVMVRVFELNYFPDLPAWARELMP